MSLPQSTQELARLARQVGIYTSIPMVMVGGPVLGFLVGRFLDQRFGSDPWGVAVAVLVGIVAGGIQTIKLIGYAQQGSDTTKRSNP